MPTIRPIRSIMQACRPATPTMHPPLFRPLLQCTVPLVLCTVLLERLFSAVRRMVATLVAAALRPSTSPTPTPSFQASPPPPR